MTSVGDYAFSGCGFDDTLTIPKTNVSIGVSAFGGLPVKRIECLRWNELEINQFDYKNDSRWYDEEKEELLPAEGTVTISNQKIVGLPAKIKINGFELSEIKIGETTYPDSNIDEFDGLPCEWSSSDEKVAEVDEDGVVTGNSIGTAEITASVLGEITGEGTIEVVEESEESEEEQEEPAGKVEQKVTALKLSGISHKIAAGKKIKLTADISPSGASNKGIIWKSSNMKVAKVSKSGVVTMKKKSGGKNVTITATTADGSGVKASYKIRSMKGVVKKIAVTGKKSVKAGKSLKLKAKVTATKKANKKLKWKSSNVKYATVSSSGKVKTLKAGKGKK